MAITGFNLDAKTINKAFVDAVRNRDFNKVAEAGELYIRQRMREEPFCRKILPPVEVTKEDCQRSLYHDTLSVMRDIAPEAKAISLTFRGEADHAYISGKRFEIPFFQIQSIEYEKKENELLAYEMPITQLIEEDIVKAMQEQEDVNFMLQVKDVVQNNNKFTQVPTADGKIDKDAIIELRKFLDGDQLETACMLMNKRTYLDLSRFNSDVVDNRAGDLLVNGYKESTVLGVPTIVTMKEDIVPYNYVYAFCAPKYLGYFYTLDEPKFWVESKKDTIHFCGWEYIGIGFGNSRGMACIQIV